MSRQIEIKIIYRNGKEEKNYVDSYKVMDGCLCTHVRFGIESGTRHIPLELIKEFTAN